MKMKKLISFLCAAALTVSSFAGLAVTASAETPKSVTVAVDAGDTTANVTTTESSAVTGVLLLAKYSNNALTSLKVSPSFTTPANDVALGAAYADGDKLMAWEDLASMKPITVTRVAKPVPKTAVNTVAELAVTATNNSKAPATITAAVTAKNGQTFTDTAAFTYAWTKDGVDINTSGATIENAVAGTYTVTATYNGTGNYEGSLGPVSITIQAADDTRTNLSGATVALDKQTATVGDTVTATVTIGDPAEDITNSADLTYQWYKAGETPTAVQGATAKTYTTTEAGTFYVTVSAAQASTTYVGTNNSGNVVVSEPVQAAPYVSGTAPAGATIRAVSVNVDDDSKTLTYKQLVEGEVKTTENTKDGADHNETYAEGSLLAQKNSKGESPVIVRIDKGDIDLTGKKAYIKFTAKTNFGSSNLTLSTATAPTTDDIAALTGETKPATGTQLKKWTNASNENAEIEITSLFDNDTSVVWFVINSESVRIQNITNLEFLVKAPHNVTVDSNITGGTITPDKTTALLGETVTLTVAPAAGKELQADSLKVNNGAVTVEAVGVDYRFTMPDADATITATFIDETTPKYAVTLTGVPGYAQVYTSADGETYTTNPVARTNNLGQIVQLGDGTAAPSAVDATDILIARQPNGSAVYYKITKAGYPDKTGSVTPNGAAVAIDASSMAPTAAGVLYSENGDWNNTDGVATMGTATCRGDAKRIRWQNGNAEVVLNTAAYSDVDKYKLAFTPLSGYGASNANKSTVYTFTDTNGLKLGSIEFHATTAWTTDVVTLVAGNAATPVEGADKKTINTAEWREITLAVDKTAKSVVVGYGSDTATFTYATETPAAVKSIKADNNVKQQIVTNLITVSTYTPVAKTPLTGVTLAAKTAATGGEDVADANITVGTVLVSTITPANATGVTYEWYRGEDKIDGATAATYTVTAADQGKTIKVVATDNADTPNSFNATKAIPAPAPVTKTVTITEPTNGTVTLKTVPETGEGVAVASGSSVKVGTTIAITATPSDAYYEVDQITVEGATKDANNQFTIGENDVTVAATFKKKAAPTVVKGTIHDTRTSGAIADSDLATGYELVNGEADNTVDGSYKINATNLQKHQNGEGTMGYWVGIIVNAPAGTTIEKYRWGASAYTEGKTLSDNTDADKSSFSFYTNVGTYPNPLWATVVLSDKRVYTYKVDTSAVTRVFAITAADAAGSYSFTTPPASATQGTNVSVTVVPETGKAITAVTVTPATAESAPISATNDSGNTWTFTMPADDVTITATAAVTATDKPTSIEVTPATATVKQGNTQQFTATPKKDGNVITGANAAVTWTVEGGAAGTSITNGLLTVAANETAKTLTVKATSAAEDNTSVIGTATVTVEEAEGTVTLTYTKSDTDKTPIAGAVVTPTAVGYSLSSVEPVFEQAGTTDANGQVTLKLNPNKYYNITATLNGETIKTTPGFKAEGAQETDKTITVEAATTTGVAEATEYNLANVIPGETVEITPIGGKVVKSITYTPTDGSATAATKGDNGKYTFKMPDEGISAITIEYAAASAATISTFAGEQLGKQQSELNEGLTFTKVDGENTYNATGTLKYVSGWTAFDGSNVDLQSGNYISFQVVVTDGTAASTISVVGNAQGSTPINVTKASEDFVIHLGGQSTALTVTVDKDGEGTDFAPEVYTINLADLEKNPAPQASTATITKRTAATYGNDASVYGDVTYTAGADNTINATGTLNYVKDVTDMGADLKDGYFLTTDVTLPDIADLDYTKATVTVKSDKWTKGGIAPAGTFSSSKKAEDFITYIASDATKVEVTVDLDGDGELYTPTVYTITWDKVTNAAAAGKLYFAPQAAPKYTATTTLTIDDKATNGGYLAISPAEAEENGTVTIKVNPEEGYQLKADSLKVMNGSTEVTATVNPSDSTTYTFSMPAGDVTVSAEFEKSASLHSYVLSATSDEQNISVPIFVFK